MLDIENNHLFMITSQGNVGCYSRDYIDQAVGYITGAVKKKSANIAIGFDGDGTGISEEIEPQSIREELAEKVPTPSSTALLIVLRLINLDYTNVMLAQCQVASYCGLADVYNRIYCESETQGGKEIILELYKILYGDREESKKIKLVDVPRNQGIFSVINGGGKINKNNKPPSEHGLPNENFEEQPSSRGPQEVNFVTIGYNGSNNAHYENVTVDYGIGGQEDRDKLLLSPFPKNTFTTNTKVIGRNNKPVGLYGGTSHVASDLSGFGEPAGSTAGWLKSSFLQNFEKKYLIVFWDDDKVNKPEDNTFEMSICSRTIDVGLTEGEKGFGLDANYDILTIGNDVSDKFKRFHVPTVTTGGRRRKSKKRTRRTNGARKSRKLRR